MMAGAGRFTRSGLLGAQRIARRNAAPAPPQVVSFRCFCSCRDLQWSPSSIVERILVRTLRLNVLSEGIELALHPGAMLCFCRISGSSRARGPNAGPPARDIKTIGRG